MQVTGTNHTAMKKKITGRALVIFIVMLIFLTFFSNTINNLTLPRVTADLPMPGDIVKQINGEGTVEAKEIFDIYAVSNAVVGEVKAETGDAVKKGQVIMVLDTEELERTYKDETARYEQKKLNLEKLMENSAPGALNNYEANVRDAEKKLEQQKKNYESTKTLYDSGAESRQNMEKAGDDLMNARQEYETAKLNRDKAARDSSREIKSLKLDMEIQQRNIEKLKEELNSTGAVTAPCDGIITAINFTRGAMANSAKPLFSLTDAAKGFRLKVTLDRDLAKYLSQGEEIEVGVESVNNLAVKGKIVEISDNEQQKGVMKDIKIDLNMAGLTGGERGEINARKNLKTKGALVSNDAIHEDNNGKYVLVVKIRKGALGNEYYVRQARVTTGESDDSKTALTEGLLLMEQVVVKSSKPLEDGDRVVVEKE